MADCPCGSGPYKASGDDALTGTFGLDLGDDGGGTHKASGDDALTGTPRPGRKPFPTPDQQAEALGWLTRRPTEFGFRTDLWTAARVAQLIRDKFGVAYHPNYLREWLTKRRHTPQMPARRAHQRQPAVPDRWLADDYPTLQKKSRPTTPTSC